MIIQAGVRNEAASVVTAQPIAQTERLDVVDIARGFALFGILIINITVFASPGTVPVLNQTGTWTDRLVGALLLTFVESKFFTLFSFLFGIGFAIQLLRAERKQTSSADENRFVTFFRRRLFFLGLFGVAHIVLLWEGDILLLYAVVGLLLIPFRKRSLKTIRRWIIGLIGVPLVLYTLLFLGSSIARFTPAAGDLALADAEVITLFAEARVTGVATYSNPDAGAILTKRVGDYVTTTAFLLATRIPTVLAMFLLGLYIGRSGILYKLADHQPLLRRARSIGLIGGLGLGTLIGIGSLFLPPVTAFTTAFFNQALAGPLTAIGYASALVLLVQNSRNPALFAPLQAYGRMALTNYLLHSIICTTLYYGYGFGLVGKIPPVGNVLIAVIINVVLIGFSMLWLRWFTFGPMEWLWRSLNYQKIQPIRIQNVSTVE